MTESSTAATEPTKRTAVRRYERLGYRGEIRATLPHAQCGKLVTVVGRTNLTFASVTLPMCVYVTLSVRAVIGKRLELSNANVGRDMMYGKSYAVR